MNTILLALALQAAAPAPPQDVQRGIAEVVKEARRSVVQVLAFVEDQDPASPVGVLSFAGLVFSPDGYIVTDGSGVDRAQGVQVVIENQGRKPGRVVGVDRRTSVAVLKIDATGLVAAAIGAVPEPVSGSFTLVLGNPFGTANGASLGSLSGTNRAIVVDNRRYEGLIQITAPTYPGDCGGLVADASGHCIGIVHSRFDGPRRLSELPELLGQAEPPKGAGTTFVTPLSVVRFVAERVIKHGKMIRGWAGVTLRPIDDQVRSQLKIEAGRGAEVSSVETGGPAEAAGLRRRDILVTWGGVPVSDIAAIQRSVTELEHEQTVKVTYVRQGESKEAEIALRIEAP